jgi:hypothetical protein
MPRGARFAAEHPRRLRLLARRLRWKWGTFLWWLSAPDRHGSPHWHGVLVWTLIGLCAAAFCFLLAADFDRYGPQGF